MSDNAATESIKVWWQTSNQLLSKGRHCLFFKVDGKIYKVKASVSDDLPYLENGKNFEGQVGKTTISRPLKYSKRLI